MHDREASPHSGGGRTILRVGIFDQRAEVAQRVAALTARSPYVTAHILGDATVPASPGDLDVLVVGLDADPAAALRLARRIVSYTPTCRVIVYGQAPAAGTLSQAMAAGAQRYLTYPFAASALHEAIVAVHDELKYLVAHARPADSEAVSSSPAAEPPRAHVIALFSPKGGVGTTTLAVNLACALAARGRRVALVDGNVSFGNVGVLLNLPHASSMVDLVHDPAGIDASIEDLLVPHASGVRVLLAPPRPEEAEIIEGDHVQRIIAALRSRYEYVIVDTWASYDPRVLAVLEAADRVLIPTTPDLQAIKNLAAFLRVAELLKLSPKLSPGVNRVDSVSSAYLQEIESFLAQPLTWRVVSDGKRVIDAVTAGVPFVLADPAAPISRDIARLAQQVDGQEDPVPTRARRPFWKTARLRFSPAP